MPNIQQVAVKLGSSVRSSGLLSLYNARFLTKSHFATSNRRPMEREAFADVEEETSVEFQRDRYVNQVTLVGEVTQVPLPISGGSKTVGYTMNVMTTRQFNSRSGRNVIKTEHNVVCFQKRLLPIIASSINVNDRVYVEGYLDRHVPPHSMTFPEDDEIGGSIVQVRCNMIEKLPTN